MSIENKEKIDALIEQLAQKYQQTGQSMVSYLEGLLEANYLSYWDYTHLDTLLTLQTPRTDWPDEQIFIMYHQITELNFKLVLHEISQILTDPPVTDEAFLMRLNRVCRYFKYLAESFDIMSEGMEKSQFLRFRMALLPASGFQSAQYRKIEISATPLLNICQQQYRDELADTDDLSRIFDHIYWKKGATELASGKKTYTLIQFEQKYEDELRKWAQAHKENNIFLAYKKHYQNSPLTPKIVEKLRQFDALVNVNWPLAHYKTAVRYLHQHPETIAATGGTNWQKYLPPRFQRRIFFPELWSETEKQEWGRAWVEEQIDNLNK